MGMMRTWANINGKLEFIGFCSARGEEWVDGGDGYMYSGNDVVELSCIIHTGRYAGKLLVDELMKDLMEAAATA